MARLRVLVVATLATVAVAVPVSGAPRELPPQDPCAVQATCVGVAVGTDPSQKPNDGSGTVTSSPPGINCRFVGGAEQASSTCLALFKSAIQTSVNVTLTATPDPGNQVSCENSAFSHAPCTHSFILAGICEEDCEITIVTFRVDRLGLTVTRSGEGSGTVTSSPAGISCGTTCTQTGIAYGTQMKLTAQADAGAVFKTWTGACNGQGATCTLTITKDTSTNAVFSLASPPGTTTTRTTTTTTTTTTIPPPPAKAKSALAARIVYAVALRKGKQRLLVVRLRVSESARAQVGLLRHGFERLEFVSSVKPGRNTLSRRIPASITHGAYQLELALRDLAGHRKTYRATVLVPG